jgi:hypothetical protein
MVFRLAMSGMHLGLVYYDASVLFSYPTVL